MNIDTRAIVRKLHEQETTARKRGFIAVPVMLDDLRPLLQYVDPTGELNPALDELEQIALPLHAALTPR